jgi:hypothetical protein
MPGSLWRTGIRSVPAGLLGETFALAVLGVLDDAVRGTQDPAIEERSTMYIGGGVLVLILIILLLIWLF